MKKFDEIFRISLGSVAVKRPLYKERDFTTLLMNIIKEALKPIKIENRLTFSLSSVDESMKQWLIIEATPGLQRELNLHVTNTPPAFSTDDPLVQSAKGQIEAAFKLLKQLVLTARLNPAEFFEIVSNSEHEHLVRTAGLDETLEWRTASGASTTVKTAKLPRQTTQIDVSTVKFDVEMVGIDKALVRFSKPERDRLNIKKVRLFLYWNCMEHWDLVEQLQTLRDERQTVRALVHLTVNSQGHTSSLAFTQFIHDE